MERFNPNMEIENNSAGLIEIIVEKRSRFRFILKQTNMMTVPII